MIVYIATTICLIIKTSYYQRHKSGGVKKHDFKTLSVEHLRLTDKLPVTIR